MQRAANHSGDSKAVNARQAPEWAGLLADAIRDPDELCDVLGLPDQVRAGARAAAQLFPLLVPRGFVALMGQGDIADPLLRQVLPMSDELNSVAGYVADPLAEAGCAPVPGVLHKYQGRALLITTGACAVHCRYCFRRHFPYQNRPRGARWWSTACDYLAQDQTIHEVLLSGGDPLTLPDVQLAALAEDLAAIPHLRRLRVHSRLPVVLPERVDDGLLAWLSGSRLRPVLVIHANHPRELSSAVAAACARLVDAGITVLNQAVLLRGVNDDLEVQVELSERLFECRVLPYYLHALDRVQGAAHFASPDSKAIAMIDGMRARLPGYLVPRLVREEPGGTGKTPIQD